MINMYNKYWTWHIYKIVMVKSVAHVIPCGLSLTTLYCGLLSSNVKGKYVQPKPIELLNVTITLYNKFKRHRCIN